MSLHLEFSDEELPDLQRLVARALNCWSPKDRPAWAVELADRIDARAERLRTEKSPIPSEKS